MNEKTKQRAMVYFISAVFILSMFGIALQYSGTSKPNTEIPENSVLNQSLSEDQKTLLLSNGRTYIIFEKQKDCGLSCDKIDEQIKKLTEKYKPYVFYYTYEGNQTKITVENLNGEIDIKSGGIDSIEEKICEVIPRHPKCVDFVATRNL